MKFILVLFICISASLSFAKTAVAEIPPKVDYGIQSNPHNYSEGASKKPVNRDTFCPHCQKGPGRDNPALLAERAERLAGKTPKSRKSRSSEDVK